MGFLFTKMGQNKTLVYDDNSSLEISEKIDGELLLKMYYNSTDKEYICITLNEEQVMSIIGVMAEFLNNYGHGRVD